MSNSKAMATESSLYKINLSDDSRILRDLEDMHLNVKILKESSDLTQAF